MDEIRRIGVCNGGGDAPGLNAVIRAVVRTSIRDYGWSVTGICNGFDGLIWPERTVPLDWASTSGLISRGGTILGTTNRGNPFAYPVEEEGRSVHRDFSHLCLENCRLLGLDALVVIGGDGTLHIASDFARMGMNIVGVPKTIDNDLSATEITFGFDTAIHTATDAIDRLHTTAESHHRVMVLEVMGRNTGWIALHSGLAGGADVVLIPEIPFMLETVCEYIHGRERAGKMFSLVIVAEGVKLPERDAHGNPLPQAARGQAGNIIGKAIQETMRRDVRVTVLGHVQRGGSPSPFDRILATRYGVCAVDLVAAGKFGRMVCLRAGQISDVPIAEAVGACKKVDPASDHVRSARAVGICFGDRL